MKRVAQLIDKAKAATGFDDFGDESFREGLQILTESADREARFTEMGAAAFDMQIVDLLACRLQVEDWYRRHPEIEEEEITAPLVGLGLPRTGSTALSHMLGEDPAARSIRGWEAMAPCPPPELTTQESDPRIARAEASMERRNRLFPRMKQMVPSTATSPTECQTFMGYDFKSQLFQAFAHVPNYVEWLNHKADLVPTYGYVKRVLKLLQWRCPPTRWRLKNPSHILFIDALAQVFPDARFWMTHRDVANVIPSVADLYCELSSAYSDRVDKAWLGAVTTDFCELGMRRMIAFRDAGHDDSFFDIQFAPFMKDPIPVIGQLYDWMGEDFTEEARARMLAWRANTPKDKHGSHTYDPAEFGIDIAALRTRFAFYSGRYGVN
ncbi:sulfotransferase [Sphingomonas sp. LaA6.9]|uniref:sulfotransferase family protein n=1 Tax=Sphingomonas sp. LaA6.9 TaxID=2919914 RepID=UPI001F4F1415|nr:sulfotransferase [Sphingomonas sp. LaA6.9]MCJ8156117.1 sulfotransferase [Sphingomonas sp. LaA6.9]